MFFLSTEIRLVDRPDAISIFFGKSNRVDNNNHGRQFELALEKKWVTQKCYFRLTTTTIGVNVTDSWLLMNHHNLFPLSVRNRYTSSDDRKIPIKSYAGMLSGQLIQMAEDMESIEKLRKRTRNEIVIFGESESSAEEDEVDDEERDEQFATFNDGKSRVIKRLLRDVSL